MKKFNDDVQEKNLVMLQNQPIAPLLIEISVPKLVPLYAFTRKVRRAAIVQPHWNLEQLWENSLANSEITPVTKPDEPLIVKFQIYLRIVLSYYSQAH